ncbi:hypothetical protein HYV49_01920 [Candidatus Pacearchaeota archaeon]|nr:hypothetical protein [Candidatus Pacearchaeota archaeon]
MFQLNKDIKNLFEKFPFGFSIWEREDNKMYAVYRNAMADKLMGTKREKMVGKEFEKCWPDSKESKKTAFRVLDEGTTHKVEESRFISKKKEGLFRFTLMKLDENMIGVVIEPLNRCIKINRDGTQCSNTSVLGNFCMSHALTQLKKTSLI